MEIDTVHHGDCINVMRNEIEDESVALTVTSPPYLNIKEYSYWDRLNDYLEDNKSWAENLYNITVPGGKVCWNTQFHIPHRLLPKEDQPKNGELNLYNLSVDIINIFTDAGFQYYGRVIWWHPAKANQRMFGSYPVSGNILLSNLEEDIYIFKKPGSYKATEKQKENSKITKEEWIEYGASIWEIPPASQKVKKGIHPAPFPKEIPHRCLKLFSRKGDIVFDPFMGSGATAEAAIDNDRHYIGAEMNDDYYNYTINHLENYKNNLFKK